MCNYLHIVYYVLSFVYQVTHKGKVVEKLRRKAIGPVKWQPVAHITYKNILDTHGTIE